MKNTLKQLLLLPSQCLVWIASAYTRLLTACLKRDFTSMLFSSITQKIDRRVSTIQHQNAAGQHVTLKLFTPNAICKMRADTFSIKEPEILRWIDTYGDDQPFWDIGANVGLYALYFAKTKPGIVYAFEPSFFNLKQLAKNIAANDLSDRINILPIPLSDTSGFQSFKQGDVEEGSALSAFGVDYQFGGEKMRSSLDYTILGMTADKLVSSQWVSGIPKLIKIDVDGIEHLILKGAVSILSAPACQSIFVEVDDNFEKQAAWIRDILTDCGFYLAEKVRSAHMQWLPPFDRVYHQIWVKRAS